MADVIIAILEFPNDPTNNKVAHQMFVGEQNVSYLDLYSVSSIPGKEKRVFGKDKDDYVTILAPEHIKNGFKVPSFIDCTKMYHIELSENMDISLLSQRDLSDELRERIKSKIFAKKNEGRHKVFNISKSDFCNWNLKAVKPK